MNYGDIIEYTDGTLDTNFNAARKWAREHNVSFNERMDLRKLPLRYFQIGEKHTPTEDEMKAGVRQVRDIYLAHWDFTQLVDAPFTEESSWWLKNPDTYEEWLEVS